jgi:uncharacterized membrane protein YhiD involved in acid resistance
VRRCLCWYRDGFGDVIVQNQVLLDPSRVAAQIVSGIGFIGGGLIFVQRDMVRGLTTVAAVWLTAAVGMTCGAALTVLALYVTAGHFPVGVGFVRLTSRVYEVTTEEDAMTDSSTLAIQLRLRGRGNLDSRVLAIRDLRGVIICAKKSRRTLTLGAPYLRKPGPSARQLGQPHMP